jgi:predicted ATPase
MLTSVNVKNFKCFDFASVPFRQLTLLSGLNSMGKSTIVQSLLLLRQSYSNQLLHKGSLSLNGELVRIGTGADALYEWANEDELGFALEFDNLKRADFTFEYEEPADVLRLVSELPDADYFEGNLFADGFRYLNAERVGPRSSFGMSDFAVRSLRQIGTQGEYTAHFLAEYGAKFTVKEELKHPAATNLSVLANVEAWLQEISPGAKLQITPYSGTDQVELRVLLSIKGKVPSKAYRSTNVGFGITYVLPVITALLSADPGSLVIIENPEAHLHPRGQVRIGELMALASAAGVQVITETHSDHVLNGIRLAVHSNKLRPERVRLLYFGRDVDSTGIKAKIFLPEIDVDGRIDDWPEGFFDEFERSLEQLFLPREVE